MNAGPERIDVPATAACYHCGDTVPAGCDLTTLIDGVEQPMCCPGCQAVASLISGSGLSNFYRQRTAFSERPAEGDLDAFEVYDDPEVAATFCIDAEGQRDASLLVGGITCPACTWLIERSLLELPGVVSARVNLQQSRLLLTLRPEQTRLSDVFRHLDALGYRPRPYEGEARRTQQLSEYRDDLRRLAVAGLGMMQVGMFAIALHAGELQGIEARFETLLRWVSLPVAAFVVLFSARPFFTTAWRHLRHGQLVMDLPVALAIGLAFAASTWATVAGTGTVYFDSVVMFTFFLLLGRFLERRARHRRDEPWQARANSLPDAVSVRVDDEWQILPRTRLCGGETLLVRAGDTVPVDARISAGISAVREDSFSGEHLPRSVGRGDMIYAGTVNLEHNLEARATGSYRDSRLAALHRAVDDASLAKPALQRFADRVAARFVAAILLLAAVTAAVWWQIDADRALWVTLSVLVVSCPCALALATPAALASATAALRSRGILVRGENALETLPQCDYFVFDKTGTLTHGNLAIDRVITLDDVPEEDVCRIAAALQQHSSHRLASAFSDISPAPDVHSVEQRLGAGIEAVQSSVRWRMGSYAFCREAAPTLSPAPDDDLLWVALCRDAEPVAWIGCADPLREETPSVLSRIREQGLSVELLTGDSSARGPRLARELGIDDVRHGMSPQQKMARVQSLQQAGATVCMVGDGLNDAPVLAAATTSVAVAGATDLTRTQADFVILRGGLDRLLTALSMARRCRRTMRQNIAWALGYNACAIPLAAAGLVPPWAAALGMSLSSLLVVGNSLRLGRVGNGEE